jgi:hypothetical protein
MNRLGTAAVKTALIVLLCSLAAGCGLSRGERDAITKFSKSTEALGAVAAEQFPAMRSEVIAMNTARLALRGYDPTLPGLSNIDGPLNPEWVAIRVRAAQVLREYGGLLTALATDDESKKLDSSIDRFIAAVKSLPEQYQSLDAAKLDAIGKAVKAIGSLYLEWQRARLLREIVIDTTPQVATVTELLAQDFDVNRNKIAAAHEEARISLTTPVTNAFRSGSLAERQTAAAAVPIIETAKQRYLQVLPQAAAAARGAGKAHAAILASVRSESFSIADIQAYVGHVQKLVTALDTLRK